MLSEVENPAQESVEAVDAVSEWVRQKRLCCHRQYEGNFPSPEQAQERAMLKLELLSELETVLKPYQ